jgi:hypothetical protein
MERGVGGRGCSMEKEEETNVDVVFKLVNGKQRREICLIYVEGGTLPVLILTIRVDFHDCRCVVSHFKSPIKFYWQILPGLHNFLIG